MFFFASHFSLNKNDVEIPLIAQDASEHLRPIRWMLHTLRIRSSCLRDPVICDGKRSFFFKCYFADAFNSLSRDVPIKAVKNHKSEVFPQFLAVLGAARFGIIDEEIN